MFRLYIVEASNLPAADLNGKSDPFVKIFFKEKDEFIKIGQTKSIKKTLNPVWDRNLEHPFNVPFYSTTENQLLFKIYDKDKLSKDDYLGECMIPPNKFVFGAPIILDVKTIKSKKSTLSIFMQSNFDNLAESQFKLSEITRLYCYTTYDPPLQKFDSELSLFMGNFDEKTFSDNVDVVNRPEIKFNRDKIDGLLTSSGKSIIYNFDLNNSQNPSKFVFVPIFEPNGYIGRVYVNFAILSISNKEISEKCCGKFKNKPFILSSHIIDVSFGMRNELVSFPVVFSIDDQTKNPIFTNISTLSTFGISHTSFFQKMKHIMDPTKGTSGISPNQAVFFPDKPFSLQKATPNPLKEINISITMNRETDHTISAAAFSESFELIGRVSAVANHSAVDDSLIYIEEGKGSLLIKLNEMNEKNVKYVIIVFTSPTAEPLNKTGITALVKNNGDGTELTSFSPGDSDANPAWMPFILSNHLGNGQFDLLPVSKFFRSQKPFDAQTRMKSLIVEENIIQSFYPSC
ncbi:hypothetical protein TRFO_10171 [Tritrichomonas foetus]|uniref:C2 domain-containing protein n=1 Tax=Tritrichomonas foetus TaxID=1144522 RepID=A0A1J4JEC0_9EUKA|nr:hypothetical protein TRFO_10171 [Tritrichomonas foetus]|eukprot:OHS96003.1 hypothetical protein TRFO_10171 [Tritrichomonas foetus]